MRTNHAHIVARDIRGEVRGALSLIAELHEVAVDAGDELRVLAGERLRIPSPALQDVVAPGAERRAPVDDQVARLAARGSSVRYSKIAVFDPRATSRTSLLSQFDISIIRIFRPFSSRRADERVVVPRPAVRVEVLDDALLVELEARVGEAAVLVDAGLGAPQIAARLRSSPTARSRSARRSSRAPRPAACRTLRCALPGPTSPARSRPAASRTDTQGCDPVACSSTKWNGGAGAPCGPQRSGLEIARADRARIAPDQLPARP